MAALSFKRLTLEYIYFLRKCVLSDLRNDEKKVESSHYFTGGHDNCTNRAICDPTKSRKSAKISKRDLCAHIMLT
jgi:hypothetical protein